MESFLNDVNGIHGEIVDAELNADKLIAGFEIQFQQLLQKFAPLRVNDTPIKPSKKKIRNRTERTNSQDVDDTLSCVSTSTNNSAAASNESEARAEDASQFMRPMRTARKQIVSMKEPTLNRKMRRENDGDQTVTVKIERESNASSLSNGTSAKNTVESQSSVEIIGESHKENMPPPAANKKVPVVKVKQEKMSIMRSDVGSNSSNATASSTNENETIVLTSTMTMARNSIDEGISSIGERDPSTSKKSNDSLDSVEIIPMESRVFEVSDDENGQEDEHRMPPPAVIPPAAKPKEKKQTSKSSKASSASDKSNDATSIKRSTRSKQVRPRIIKQEPVDETSSPPKASTSTSSSTRAESASESNSSSVASTVRPSAAKPTRPLNVTGESLYEDAVSDQTRMFNAYVRLDKVADTELPSSQQSDATFVTTSGETDSQPLSPRATYVVPKKGQTTDPNATFQVNDDAQSTMVASAATNGATHKKRLSAASIMTDDDSDCEIPTKNVVRLASSKTSSSINKKNPKELFNPCLQKTTVKQKAEAFEKLASPVAAPRETRTRTRQMTNDSDKFVKPQVPSATKPSVASHVRTNSATRHAQINSKYPSGATLQKAQSVEEIRKKTQQAVADERKKKNDEKLRQIKQQREAVEQEKAEKLKKIVSEKEQRAREIQQKKQMEEMRKLQEQKRKEAERKEAKARQDRKERENLKILNEQKALQEKLKAKQLAAEADAARQPKMNPYNFDMIESEDSTDDEGKESRKRPPPPTWSLAHKRLDYIRVQAEIPSKIIDGFFSVAPRQVDLREIFPAIDDKHLRRNSSAVWNTPPRYSLMPKY